MKRLIIIGAGNIGKIVYEYARLMKEYKTEWDIAGFLEFSDKEVVADPAYPVIIDSIEDYQPQADDVFVCSYSDEEERERSVALVKSKNAQFINIIHPTANILSTNKMGVGNVIGAFTTISVNTTIGNHCVIQDHCNVGHDSVIGDYSHLYVGNIVCGFNTLGESTTVFTGSVIYPKLKVGSKASIGAGSVVTKDIPSMSVAVGNPCRVIKKLKD